MASSVAQVVQEKEPKRRGSKVLMLGVPVHDGIFTVCLQMGHRPNSPSGKEEEVVIHVKSVSPAWEDDVFIHERLQWIVNGLNKPLGHTATIPDHDDISVVEIVDWEEFLVALQYLHRPTA